MKTPKFPSLRMQRIAKGLNAPRSIKGVGYWFLVAVLIALIIYNTLILCGF